MHRNIDPEGLVRFVNAAFCLCFKGIQMEVTSQDSIMWNTHLSRDFYMSKENIMSEYLR